MTDANVEPGHDLDPTLELDLEAHRFSVLRHLAALSDRATPAQIKQADGLWKAFRRRVYTEVNKDPMSDGDAEGYLRHNVWLTAPWQRFIKMRTRMLKNTKRYRERQKEYDATTRKEHRRKPEVRSTMNAQRRERYRKSKEAKAQMAAILDSV